ncbi:DUF423 domain-containing protein [Methylopila turkensis]|uniref:DUF423 domain-containing protein n=1 Tax=Methylopila turkensis TaxID=1437816 RepID=A0A9W6JPB4_9HYPH|nr:DUF423 domain-containing protein [Methylopila turkensis]GLK81285.1 hypothetical protein GCM10008174_30260 [Methylopila turkensis]
MSSRFPLVLIAIAGVYGAVGVAAAAAASHAFDDPRLGLASTFLLLHAAALAGLASAVRAFAARWTLGASAALIALGALLFCGDLMLRVVAGASPLPFAAPLGGSLLIVGWLGVAAGAVVLALRTPPKG